MTETAITLNQQIKAVEREIAMRSRVYPGWVSRGKMRQSEADYEMAAMRATLATLQWLQANETAVRAAVAKVSP